MNAWTPPMGLSLLLLASAAVAAPPTCQPTLAKAWIRSAPPGAMMLAGYVTLRNPCPKALVVVAVAADGFASATMHETLVEDGVSKMRQLGRLSVPAGGVLQFAPGGRHLMLMQPRHPLRSGERSTISLVLADGRRITAAFAVAGQAPPR